MKERREYIRIDESFRITYRVISPPHSKAGDSTGVNISEGGISFPSSQELCPGFILELGISFRKTMEPIVATGEVTWVTERDDPKYPHMLGIKFIQITPRDKDRIYYHIHKRMEEKGPPSDIQWID
jgi:c-di-GMP-binding flagellar brake protein YcgR